MSLITPPIIGFCGASDSGKTTLVAGVIEALTARGLTIGAIKHHGHPDPVLPPEDPEKPKDSTRLALAGAKRVALSHAGGILLTADKSEAHLEPALIAAAYMHGLDLVIVEGYKYADIPKIEVVGPNREPMLPPGGRILALAIRGGQGDNNFGLPVLDANRPGDVAAYVIDYYKL